MENPQAQMQQGQPGPAPEQMQQGAPQGQPQQGGQDPQMQQIMQLVQQMMQQGVQPVEAAAELLSKQVPPEIVMQVFVQLGMPEQDAQAAIQQAMEGGQQQQGQGEEQMEGQASNPQEETEEEESEENEENEEASPAEEIQMKYGGRMPRRLRSYAEGGDNQEMQAVMQQVQDMMSQGSDARQVMEQIQAAVQQGQISPEVGTSVMEQLSGMQQATNPQGDDAAMAEQSQDPQEMDPNVAAPEAQMLKFGGNLKKLMSRAYGGPAVAPGTDSKTYAQDRTSMFVNAVKNSAFKSTLDDEFPSLGGNNRAYGGDLPKAVDGFDVTKYKTADEAELAAYRYKQGLSPEEQAKFDVTSTLKTWKAPEPTYEAGKSYSYDPATKQFKIQDQQQNPNAANYGYSSINPVGYQNPMGNSFWDNVNAGASPFARMLSGIGTNNMYDPRVTGANLPGGMNANQFLGAIGANGLVPGMAGKVGEQNWRVGEAEKFKEGSIWKGNRRKGVRYQIDWGDAAAMNPVEATSTPPAGTTIQTDVNGNQISVAPKDWRTANTQVPGTVSFDQPPAAIVANQSTVAPDASTVVNPASEVNQVDQNTPEQFPSLIPGSNKMVSQEAIDFQKNQAAKGLEWNGQSWVPNKQMRDIATMVNPNVSKSQDVSGVANATASGTVNYADSNPRSSAPEQAVVATVDNSQASQSMTPEQKFQMDADNAVSLAKEEAEKQKRRKAYGGPISQEALSNAIDLINRAFGGNIPKAVDGVDLGSEDANGNKIPDYLEADSLPANQPNPFGNKGTVEQSAGKKLDINWNQVGSAAGDMYMNTASKVTNFANKMNAMNPERDMAKMSALNRPSNTYDTMKQGLYDQAGNFIPNDIGNQVLNPTDTYYNNQQQIFSYGGKVYAIGGEVDLEDDEMEQLAAAGFKLSRV